MKCELCEVLINCKYKKSKYMKLLLPRLNIIVHISYFGSLKMIVHFLFLVIKMKFYERILWLKIVVAQLFLNFVFFCLLTIILRRNEYYNTSRSLQDSVHLYIFF